MANNKKLTKIPQEIRFLPFFYPDIKDSSQATEFIRQHDSTEHGYYLVRLSSKGDNFLTISVSISDHSIRHVNVVFEHNRDSDTYQYYIVPEMKFKAFSQLCRFYREHRIGNLEKIDNVRLLRPIIKSSQDSHDYERLGNVGGGISAGGGPDTGRKVQAKLCDMPSPVSQNPSFSPMNPDVLSAIQWGVGDSGAVRQRTRSRTSLDSQSSESQQAAPTPNEQGPPTSQGQRNPLFKSPFGGKSQAKLKVNGKLDRPPLPIPNCNSRSDVYYSSPRENINKIEHLRKMLKSTEICDCGLLLIDSELPLGYTIHRSHEEGSKNRLFYQSAKGETSWNFPQHLLLELTERQRQAIIRLSTEKGMEPPKILFNPDYTEMMTILLEQKKLQAAGQTVPSQATGQPVSVRGTGQTVPVQPAVIGQPGTHPQFDLASQVMPPGQQQLLTASGGSGGHEGPPPSQVEDSSPTQVQRVSGVNVQQQYLSSTLLMYVPSSPEIVYHSQNQKHLQVGNGFHFEPQQAEEDGNKQTFPKFPQKK